MSHVYISSSVRRWRGNARHTGACQGSAWADQDRRFCSRLVRSSRLLSRTLFLAFLVPLVRSAPVTIGFESGVTRAGACCCAAPVEDGSCALRSRLPHSRTTHTRYRPVFPVGVSRDRPLQRGAGGDERAAELRSVEAAERTRPLQALRLPQDPLSRQHPPPQHQGPQRIAGQGPGTVRRPAGRQEHARAL